MTEHQGVFYTPQTSWLWTVVTEGHRCFKLFRPGRRVLEGGREAPPSLLSGKPSGKKKKLFPGLTGPWGHSELACRKPAMGGGWRCSTSFCLNGPKASAGSWSVWGQRPKVKSAGGRKEDVGEEKIFQGIIKEETGD